MFKNLIIDFTHQEISAEKGEINCNCVCAMNRQNYGPCQYGTLSLNSSPVSTLAGRCGRGSRVASRRKPTSKFIFYHCIFTRFTGDGHIFFISGCFDNFLKELNVSLLICVFKKMSLHTHLLPYGRLSVKAWGSQV